MSVFNGLKSTFHAERQPATAEQPERSDPTAISVSLVPRAAALPWKVIALQAAGLWLVSRIAYVVFTYFAVILNAQGTNKPPNVHPLGPAAMLQAWNRWDVGWYASIANDGYHSAISTAFFPFFPFVTHLLTVVVGQSNVVAAAMIVANLGMLVACIALGLLAANEFGADTAGFAVKAAIAYPMAFFTFAAYSDSWFLAFCTFALLFARRSMWRWASLATFLAAVSRPVAIVLIVPLIWEFGRQLHERGLLSRRRLTLRAAMDGLMVGAAVPSGLVAYGVYLYTKFHDPLIWTKAQRSGWDHQTLLPWKTVQIAVDTLQRTPPWTFPQSRLLMDLGAVVLFTVLTVIAARQVPVMYTLYMAALVLVLLTAAVPADFDPFNAESRYLIMSAPIFVVLGRWMARRPWLDLLVVGGGFLIQGVLATYWIRGGWIV